MKTRLKGKSKEINLEENNVCEKIMREKINIIENMSVINIDKKKIEESSKKKTRKEIINNNKKLITNISSCSTICSSDNSIIKVQENDNIKSNEYKKINNDQNDNSNNNYDNNKRYKRAKECINNMNKLCVSPEDEKKKYIINESYNDINFLFYGESMKLITSHEGMYGEIRISSMRMLLKEIFYFGFDEFSVFLDIGSGRGVPTFLAAKGYNLLASLGIEMCGEAYAHSIRHLKVFLDKETELFEIKKKNEKKNISSVRVGFCNEDASAFKNFNGCTHLYSFDPCMEWPLMSKLVDTFMATETAWVWASYRKDLITKHNLQGCSIMKQITMQMSVSGESHQCYIYVKNNWLYYKKNSEEYIYNNILNLNYEHEYDSSLDTIQPCTHFHVSRWLQPLKTDDLIKLSICSLYEKKKWVYDKVDKCNGNVKTRKHADRKWGFSWEERRLEWSKRADILQKIAYNESNSPDNDNYNINNNNLLNNTNNNHHNIHSFFSQYNHHTANNPHARYVSMYNHPHIYNYGSSNMIYDNTNYQYLSVLQSDFAPVTDKSNLSPIRKRSVSRGIRKYMENDLYNSSIIKKNDSTDANININKISPIKQKVYNRTPIKRSNPRNLTNTNARIITNNIDNNNDENKTVSTNSNNVLARSLPIQFMYEHSDELSFTPLTRTVYKNILCDFDSLNLKKNNSNNN